MIENHLHSALVLVLLLRKQSFQPVHTFCTSVVTSATTDGDLVLYYLVNRVMPLSTLLCGDLV